MPARIFVGVSLLIPLEVVPLREDDTPKAIDDRREVAGGGVVHQEQIAVRRIQTPEPRHHRRGFVFVVLRMEVAFTATWTVGGEDDPVVRAVERRDVIIVRWLVWHLGDDGLLVLAEAGDFVELPDKVLPLELLCRRADRHREDRLLTVPMYTGVAHGDGLIELQALHAEAGCLGQILQRAVGIAYPEITAARRLLHAGIVIAEGRRDGREVSAYRNLRDEQHRKCAGCNGWRRGWSDWRW